GRAREERSIALEVLQQSEGRGGVERPAFVAHRLSVTHAELDARADVRSQRLGAPARLRDHPLCDVNAERVKAELGGAEAKVAAAAADVDEPAARAAETIDGGGEGQANALRAEGIREGFRAVDVRRVQPAPGAVGEVAARVNRITHGRRPSPG